MPKRKPLPAGIDLNKLVKFEANTFGPRYRVASGDKRAGREGVCIGSIILKHAGGYEVVLRHDDGTIDTYAPFSLFPIIEEPA